MPAACAMLAQTGEFLTFDNNLKLQLEPMLAPAGRHNGDGSVWTFKLRPNVKFHNGSAMTADDVVYTFKQLSDPKNASNALSTFSGVLTPSGRPQGRLRTRSPSTSRRRTATSRTSSPPTTTTRSSSPRAPTSRKWQKTFVGTGPFKLQSYTQNVGANFVANPDYWGPKPHLDGDRVQVLQLPAAADPGAAGRRRRRDRRSSCPRAREAILNNSQYNIIKLQVLQPSRAVDAQRPGAVHRRARAPGDRADVQPPGDGVGAAARAGQRRQRQPVRARSSRRRTRACPSASRTSPRPSS